MDYLLVSEIAARWGISERSVRNYCAQGRVEGAFLAGKTWMIPAGAAKPSRKNAARGNGVLDALWREKAADVRGSLYHRVQIDFTYNSNHIEGSTLTHDQTRWIFETSTVGVDGGALNVDDIVEAVNHFRCIDLCIDRARHAMSTGLMRELHRTLKTSTSDVRQSWFAVGEYKRLPNEVGGRATTAPEDVERELEQLVAAYNEGGDKTLEDLVAFHVAFERIHPFQDGNGRVGRLLLFKECLHWGIVPFIIDESLRLFYYRGLQYWNEETGYLMDTCLTAQDRFKALLDYFRIVY